MNRNTVANEITKNLETKLKSVQLNYNSVELVNVTGPMDREECVRHVEADFNANVKGPISIVSVYGYVDVNLPSATKADI